MRCRQSTPSESGSIVAPWEAVILRRNEIDHNAIPSKICSGSILNERMILTSVSCAKKERFVGVPLEEAKLRKVPTLAEKDIRQQLTTNNLEVWVGLRNESFLNDTGGEMLAVKEIISHPSYTETLGSIPDWDYAIILLEKSIDFSKMPNLSPVCLLPSNTSVKYHGQPLRTHFWRYIPPTYDTINLRVEPTQLLASLTTSNVFSNKECKENALKKEWISDRFICSAEGMQTNSGSGQLIQVGNNVSVLVGVGSYNSLYGMAEKQNLKQIALLADLCYGRAFIDEQVNKIGLSTCQADQSTINNSNSVKSDKTLDELAPIGFSRRPWLQFTSEYRRVLPPQEGGCRCGLRKVTTPNAQTAKLTPRIWHGQDFDTLYEYNWHANLGAPNFLHRLLCGGSLINDKIILTAAHCIGDVDAPPQKRSFVKLRGKDSYFDEYANDTYAIYSYVNPDAQAIHPDYMGRKGTKRDGKSYNYDPSSFDVGLLVLNDSLQIGNTPDLGTACLPFTGEYQKIEGDTATVIGNGFWHKGTYGGLSTMPQKLQFNISDLNLCRKQWFGWHRVDMQIGNLYKGYDYIIADTVICHGEATNENFTGQASGDSGSSVFISAARQSPGNAEEQLIQVGIVSSGVSRKIIEYAEGRNVTLPDDPRITELMTGVMDHETLSFIDYISFYHNVAWCFRAPLL